MTIYGAHGTGSTARLQLANQMVTIKSSRGHSPTAAFSPQPRCVRVQPGAPAEVPEPSTWAMILLGFAGLGSAAFRRNSTKSPGACRADAIAFVSETYSKGRREAALSFVLTVRLRKPSFLRVAPGRLVAQNSGITPGSARWCSLSAAARAKRSNKALRLPGAMRFSSASRTTSAP